MCLQSEFKKKITLYLSGTLLDFLQHSASLCYTLLELLVAVLDGHDQVMDDVTVLLPAHLGEPVSRVLH